MLTQRFSSFNGNNISPWCHQIASAAPRSESKHNVPGRRSSGGRSLMRREMKLANVNVLHDDLDAHTELSEAVLLNNEGRRRWRRPGE